MVAEFEADLIRLRTKQGMRVAKAKGRLRGKQPKLNPRQEAHLVALLKSGEYSTVQREITSTTVNGELREYALRVTHVYRREDGTWKVIHRYADEEPDTEQGP